MCLHDEFEYWPISCKKTQNMLQNHSKTPWINLPLKTTLFEVWTAANFSRNSFEVKKKTGQLCLFNFHKPQFSFGWMWIHVTKSFVMTKKFRSIWTHLQLSAHHNHRGLCVSNHWTLSTWYQKEWWMALPQMKYIGLLAIKP